MIDFALRKGKIELQQYSEDTTLAQFADAVEELLASPRKKAATCHRCGQCCNNPPVLGLDMAILSAKAGIPVGQWVKEHLLPIELPDLASRRKGIAELSSQAHLSETEATILYEFNQSEPLTFKQNVDESCSYLQGGLCSNYNNRPYICRLYQCSLGDRLQSLREMIVCQGTWYAYALLGAVPAEEIDHNPFLSAKAYHDVKLKDFEHDMEKSLEALFSYF